MNSNIINEKEIKDHSKSIQSETLEKILVQLKKSICKIDLKEGGHGTGFFCAIPFPDKYNQLPFLITNNHVLSKDDIIVGKKINIILNNNEKKEINIDSSRKTYTNKKYDITFIEIKDNDNLDKKSFLEIDEQIFRNEPNNYENKSIYIIHYPYGIESHYTLGLIDKIEDNYDIFHSCQTEEGSSGGPIINSKGNRVIGVHKGCDKNQEINFNYGTFIREPIENFLNFYNDKKIVEENNIINDIVLNNNLINNDLEDNLIVEKVIISEEGITKNYKVIIGGKEYTFRINYSENKKYNYEGENKIITLISNEGNREEISLKTAFRSELIQNILKINSNIREIHLDIKIRIIKQIKEYLEHYENKETKKIEKPLPSKNFKEYVDEWDNNYMDLDLENIIEILKGANILDIRSLMELSGTKLASIIKGKSTEQIRNIFNIESDFTPEEEREISEENKWANEDQ